MVKMERKPRDQRFGNLVSEPDAVKQGQYMPWARFQKPGAVKEVTFHADARKAYLTGFRKRKTERSKVAKKNIVSKELKEKRPTAAADVGREPPRPEGVPWEKHHSDGMSANRSKDKRDNMRELMQSYDERQKKMQAMNQGIEEANSDDSSSDEEEEEEGAAGGQAKLEFFDASSGSATTVEVAEMNLEDIHSVSVSASTLPALPPPEKAVSKKIKKLGKGRARQLKKDRLQKSKRAKHQGGRAGKH